MSVVANFLDLHRARLDIARYHLDGAYSSLMLTPRFKASRHVIFLLMPEGQSEPTLVAKLPRLQKASDSLDREANNLMAIQAQYGKKLESIPEVIAYETYCGYPILVETALNGILMDNAYLRRHFDACCHAVVDWLVTLQPQDQAVLDRHEFKRLVDDPLTYFTRFFPLNSEERQFLDATEELVAPLSNMALPRVVEHGDLSHPNLIMDRQGKLGVVDWELATTDGLPACDLFFFLSYAAFALQRARTNDEYIAAFHKAFFEPEGSARPYVRSYLKRLDIPNSAVKPFFVLCWIRYLIQLVQRLEAPDQPVSQATADWLRTNRYYALWQYTVTHAGELDGAW